jgi:ferrous iron transport protein B
VNALIAACVQQVKDAGKEDAPLSYRIDRWILHPVFGPLIFASLMFLVFQAVFAWAQLPMDLIKSSIEGLGSLVESALPAGMLQELLVKGVIGGAGSVLVFLPQIVILFFFILVMEDSGYLPGQRFYSIELWGK